MLTRIFLNEIIHAIQYVRLELFEQIINVEINCLTVRHIIKTDVSCALCQLFL
jgi:hypothetical protein